ncbi:hypothetical protein H7994_00460 [Escherichia coli O150:H6]|nr:hypothetical protein [Escherichia coli]QPJ22732.1 hypothetical protein H7994_00460 [Escherichia coli O150:H6]
MKLNDSNLFRQQALMVQTLLASQSNPGRTLRAARSVDALHAAFNQ